MGVKDCTNCLRYTVIALSVLYAFVGLGVFIIAICMHVAPPDKDYFERNVDFYEQTYYLMGIGLFMSMVAILGCYAAHKENTCLLLMFFVFLAFILGVAIFIGVVCAAYNYNMEVVFYQILMEMIQKEYLVVTETTDFIDYLQTSLHCCGARGSLDWKVSEYNKKRCGNNWFGDCPLMVPKSCCIYQDSLLCDGARKAIFKGKMGGELFSDGCSSALITEIQTIVIGVGVAVTLVEVADMIFTIILWWTLRRRTPTTPFQALCNVG